MKTLQHLFSLLFVLLLCGCYSAVAQIHLDQAHLSRFTTSKANVKAVTELTPAGERELIKAVEAVASGAGLKPVTKADTPSRKYLAEVGDYVVVAAYSSPVGGTQREASHGRVMLSVQLRNDRRAARIVLRDLDHAGPTEYTSALAESIASKLREMNIDTDPVISWDRLFTLFGS